MSTKIMLTILVFYQSRLIVVELGLLVNLMFHVILLKAQSNGLTIIFTTLFCFPDDIAYLSEQEGV